MRLRLKDLREQQGMSQQKLAKALSRSLRTIQAWELGESFPNADVVCRCAEIFGTDPNDVLGWYDDHEQAAARDCNEIALVRSYRALTPDRKRAVLTMASDGAALSRGEAERRGVVAGGAVA